MRTNAILFWILAVFFAIADAAYTIWALIYYPQNLPWTQRVEWVGSVALLLAAILAVFLAFFLSRTVAGFGGLLPEDRLDANIDDGDPEIGDFSPWSWWPIFLAGAVSVMALGLAAGIWIAIIGVPLLLIALVGWTYEYYRGFFAR